jgi:hypothetical protein
MSQNAGRAYVTQEFSLISSLEYSHNIEEIITRQRSIVCAMAVKSIPL